MWWFLKVNCARKYNSVAHSKTVRVVSFRHAKYNENCRKLKSKLYIVFAMQNDKNGRSKSELFDSMVFLKVDFAHPEGKVCAALRREHHF